MFRESVVDLGPVLAASHNVRARAELWRGDEYLGSAPIVDGQLIEAGDQLVEGTLDLTVPAVDRAGRSWVPVDPLDPLNTFGQRVALSYDVQRADGTWLPTPLGWFILDEWELDDDGSVLVSALDATDALRTARLLTPMTPKSGGTFVSELRRLVGGRLPLDVTAAPADRAVPSGMSWDEERLDAIDELLTAWPARAELDSDGVLVVKADTLATDPADVELVEGQGGTVVGRKRAGGRAGLANVVVARGDDTGDPAAPPVVGYAADEDPDSPTNVNGPMGELVRFFASPLLRTEAQAKAAAASILAKSLRPAQTIPVTTLPDPRIGVNTRVDITLSDGSTVRTIVLAATLPLTGEGGPQQLELGVIP